LRDLLILFYAGAIGFVAAGIAASFYKMVTQEQARFRMMGTTLIAGITMFCFFALTGPVIVMNQSLTMLRGEKNGLAWLAAGVLVAGLWSCCLGILMLAVVVSFKTA
jgi:Family of unknown function (DUF6949)